MSLNYNFVDTLNLLTSAFKYNIFIAIIISSIVFTIILIINKDKKLIKYSVSAINIVLISSIIYYYFDDIIGFKFNNPINNIYFYFLNTIIYLIIMNMLTIFSYKKNINFIFYGISLINILFSLFMTHYLKNNTLIVIGNIFPMIKFGNIIYIIYYIVMVVYLLRYIISKRK